MIVIKHYPLVEFNGCPLLIGDGTKVCKEATKMPAVKSLHQDSENSGKPEFIKGHHIGMVGALVGHLGKFLCIPLEGRIHEGIGPFQDRQRVPTQAETPVSLMARQLLDKAKQIGHPCYAVLDAYFAVKTSFLAFTGAVNDDGRRWVHLITRAKANYVAYWKHPDEHHNPTCKWEKVHLADLFDRPDTFDEGRIVIQGKIKNIKYTYLDMLWKPVNDWLRFVWVIDGTGHYILMCSDLTLRPELIIQIYCCRWSIEVMFMALKHLIGGFCYRFWTKHFPKLERGQTLASVQLSEVQIAKCFQTVCAIERFVNLAGVALGLLQYLALTKPADIWSHYEGWLRTQSSEIPSEAVVQNVLRAEFFAKGSKVPVSRTLSIIRSKDRKASLPKAA